jgi:arginyl-tRNA synthetase
MQLKQAINQEIKNAFQRAGIESTPIGVSEATKPEFGDFQFNGAMALAKALKQNPRQIAQSITDHLEIGVVIERVEIAGPGFINIWLNEGWVASKVAEVFQSETLGIVKKEHPQKVIVDYSGPNMAKQMHVGHLRSTIIGDTLANLLSFLGDEVIRQNHIGDWGTQFGMLIAYLEEMGTGGSDNLKDLEQFYKNAKKRFDSHEVFAMKAREYVVKIQSGDAHCLALWQRFITSSLGHCEEVYHKLGVKLTRDDVRAESFYNDDLEHVITDLEKANLLQESSGAKCVFIEGDEVPVIVQKGDGGYLYATTDLAALRFRAKALQAHRVLYVVDARQSAHFRQVFHVAKEAGFVPSETQLEHVAFGTMMGEDGKPFKTRDGGTVKLVDLLDEAVLKAKTSIHNKESMVVDDLEALAKVVGIGAVKYADLSINRESNYRFNWDKMLSFDGNTSLYMQYAYARIQSIFRKYQASERSMEGEIVIGDVLEHKLALALLSFEDVLQKTAIDAMPSYITTYLYDLVTHFMRFYEQNPILKEGVSQEVQVSRLKLALVTAKTIKQGLDILGIEVVDRL